MYIPHGLIAIFVIFCILAVLEENPLLAKIVLYTLAFAVFIAAVSLFPLPTMSVTIMLVFIRRRKELYATFIQPFRPRPTSPHKPPPLFPRIPVRPR